MSNARNKCNIICLRLLHNKILRENSEVLHEWRDIP